MRRAAPFAVLLALAACAQPPGGGEAGTAVGTLPPPAADTPAAEASVPMDSLLHVRTGELRARFGDPHAQRRDGGAIIWNYEADGVCRLNLVLQGVRGAAAEVVHAQARMAPGGTEANCFERLRQEARASPVPVLESVAVAPVPVPVPMQAARNQRLQRPAAPARAAAAPARPAPRQPAARASQQQQQQANQRRGS